MSSFIKNKEVEVEENHRNLLLSKNKKHMSSECNNIKLAIRNDKFEVLCAICKYNTSCFQVVSKSFAVYATDAPNQRQHLTTPLTNHTTPAPTCQILTLAPTVISSENINQAETYAENDQVTNDEFINIFSNPVQDQMETSSRHVAFERIRDVFSVVILSIHSLENTSGSGKKKLENMGKCLTGKLLSMVRSEYMPLEDDILPAKEQPLSAAASPTGDSPGYIHESDPKEEFSGDDVDDEEENEDEDEEEEEHPAPADSIP
nr:hypothetical protein [Tanacetum cinerariifolium]